jgi:hypothetical protein
MPLIGLGVLFAPTSEVRAQSQSDLAELLRDIINLQSQAIESGNPDIIAQARTLLTQAQQLVVQVRENAGLANEAGEDTFASEGTFDDNTSSDTNTLGGTSTFSEFRECPELTLSQREIYNRLDRADGDRGWRRVALTESTECLGKAIFEGCDSARADHVDGYTFYVYRDSGNKEIAGGIFGGQRCYMGISPTDEPNNAVMCDLYEVARETQPADANLLSVGNLRRLAERELPEYFADHAYPFKEDAVNYAYTRDRDNSPNLFSYYGQDDPLSRLSAQMPCTEWSLKDRVEEDAQDDRL